VARKGKAFCLPNKAITKKNILKNNGIDIKIQNETRSAKDGTSDRNLESCAIFKVYAST